MASLDPSSSTQRAGGEINVAVEEEDTLPQLPFDLLLNIVQRADAVTIVRCAATQKLLRGAILSPAFRPRLGVVDPALLLGFSFWKRRGHRSIDTPPQPTGGRAGGGQPRVRLDDDAIAGFKPVAWRDGLLLLIERHLGRDRETYDLRVCNALTGDVTASLPPISLPDKPSSGSPSKCNMYWPRRSSFVFLTAGTAGRSFELLAANTGLQTQIFSSDRWEWGPVRHTSFPQYQPLTYLEHVSFHAFSRPTIIGRTIYWLCSQPPPGEPMAFRQHGAGNLEPEILSLDVDAAEATVTSIPRSCFSEMVFRKGCFFDTSALLTSVRGKLFLFILEKNGMSAWAPSDGDSTAWSMQFMLNRLELEARAALDLDPHGFRQLCLHAYGERSGAMIVEVTALRVFLRIDIGEDFDLVRVGILGSESKPRNITFLCLHETDLDFLLQSMKSFPQGLHNVADQEDLRAGAEAMNLESRMQGAGSSNPSLRLEDRRLDDHQDDINND